MKHIAILFTLITSTAVFTPGLIPASSITPTAINDEILDRIRRQAEAAYSRYEGVESQREITSNQYDSNTGNLLESYDVILQRKEYFYKRAEYTVVKYIRDGKVLPPEKYNYRTRDPVFPPLDSNNGMNYQIKLNGETTISGKRCYELEVVPRKKTARHLLGKMYFTVDGLDLYYLEGTIAKLPFGLKSLQMNIYFKRVDDAWVMSHGTYIFKVHIPVFYPNRKFVTCFTSTNDRLIPYKK